MPTDDGSQAYTKILSIVGQKAGMRPEHIRCDHRILHDFNIYGDDAEEMIVEVADVVGLNPAEFDFERYFFSEVFAFWLLPPFLKRRALAGKRPLTVGDLLSCVSTGRWPTWGDSG